MVTYLGTAPKYRRIRAAGSPDIRTAQLSPPTSPVRQPSYQQLSQSRSRVPQSPLSANMRQLQDLPTRRIKSVRSIDTTSGQGTFGLTEAGTQAFKAIVETLGEKFFQNSHSRTQPFSSFERSSFGGVTPEQVRTSGMGAGEFSDWFR